MASRNSKDSSWRKDKRQRRHSTTRKQTGGATTGYGTELWAISDALRGSMDAAEYKHAQISVRITRFDDIFTFRIEGHVKRHLDIHLVTAPFGLRCAAVDSDVSLVVQHRPNPIIRFRYRKLWMN